MIIMAQPTQDINISSSFIPNNNSPTNDCLTKRYDKDTQMDAGNETNLTYIHNDFIDLSENYANQECLDSQSLDIKSSKDTLPWLTKFNKVMCSSVGNRSYQLLEHLLSLYIQNILTSIKTYCMKAFNTMKHVRDSDSYLNGMAVLLEVYIDMELKTFRHSKDSAKIVAKLLSALWIYLDKSEKHIFRVLLKMKLITKKYAKICEPIFTKLFITLRRNMESITDIDYVRYLLVLKLWKRMKENHEEKKEVHKIALMTLGPCIPKMRDELLKIIPKPPIGYRNETFWLLQPNVFDLKEACNRFLAFEDAISFQYKDSASTKNSGKLMVISSCGINYTAECATNYESNKTKISNSQNSNYFRNIKNGSKLANHISSIKKNKFKKYKAVSKLKPGELILIDLTKEDETSKVNESKRERKKCKRKPEWLKLIKKKYKVQKQNNTLKCSNKVEIADAHSTESLDNSVDKILLEHLPISDNKVSESTESCASLEPESLQDNTHHYINPQNMQDYIHKKKNKELKCMFQHKQCDICISLLKQNDIQHNKVLRLMKLLNTFGQNIKEPKSIINLLNENSKQQSATTPQHTLHCRNIAKESNEINTQGKEETFSQPKCSKETIPLSKECQNSITDTQSIKQELPTSTDYDISEVDTYFRNKPVYVQSNCHIHNFKPTTNYNSEIIETIKQNISCDAQECIGCYKQNEAKSFYCSSSNVFSSLNSEYTMQNAIDNTIDKKSICDKNVICMLSDLDKCVDVLNRIGEHIMNVHAKKQRLECLDKTDICAVSTTVSGDQYTESSLGWTENINSLTNSEKVNKILELYEKREFLNACHYKDIHRWSNKGAIAEIDQLKCESNNDGKIMIPTSEPKELHYHRKENSMFSENKSIRNFVCNEIKSEFEGSIKEEDSEKFQTVTHESQKLSEHKITMITNSKIDTTESLVYDLKTTEKLKQDINCESALQNFSQKTDTTKTLSVDEFENIDILDSILNGDITMEDEQEIFEDSQSLLMSPINYDNSNNVLNCITEFFSQSENSYTKEIEEKYTMSDTENSLTLLPEGSLGTTGILNSLLDFDLTNIDSSENDCTYLNLQAVDPRLIKKSFKEDNLSETNDSTFELNYQKTKFMTEEKEKELCSKQNNSIGSNVDVSGFGLNSNRRETLEHCSLTQTSSLSDQSTLLVNSGNISSELKKPYPKCSNYKSTHKLNTDTPTESSYIFQEENNSQVQSLNDAINCVPLEICTPNNAILSHCISSPKEEFSSSHKHTVRVGRSSLTMKQSLKSYNLMSSTDLMSCNAVTKCDNFTKQISVQKNIQHNCKNKQNRNMRHRLEVSAQTRTPKRKIRQKKKLQIEEKDMSSFIIESDEHELNLRCPQLTLFNHQNMQSMCKSPISTSYHQKLLHTKNLYKNLKYVDMQQLRSMSQQKQQISLKCGDSIRGATLKEDSRYITEDHDLEDSNTLKNKPLENSYILQNTTYFKSTKRNVKIDRDIPEVNITVDEHVTDIPSSINHPNIKWSLKNVDTHSSKSVKKQVVAVLDEEIPIKKKKLTHEFSSTSEENAIVCLRNQQGTQKKHVTSMKRGFICTNRQRYMVGE